MAPLRSATNVGYCWDRLNVVVKWQQTFYEVVMAHISDESEHRGLLKSGWSLSMPISHTLLYVVMLQACLDTGYFTRRISFVKVYRLVSTSCVVAGTLKSCRTASPLTFGTRFRFIFGTPFGGYLHARAGTGKLFGTGATVSTSGRAVLLWDLDFPHQRR